jgi:hypothetical protein
MLDILLALRSRFRIRREKDVVLKPFDRADFKSTAGREVGRSGHERFLLAFRGELDDRAGCGSDGELLALDGPAGGSGREIGGEGSMDGRCLEVEDGERRGGGRGEDREEGRVGSRIRAKVDQGFARDEGWQRLQRRAL